MLVNLSFLHYTCYCLIVLMCFSDIHTLQCFWNRSPLLTCCVSHKPNVLEMIAGDCCYVRLRGREETKCKCDLLCSAHPVCSLISHVCGGLWLRHFGILLIVVCVCAFVNSENSSRRRVRLLVFHRGRSGIAQRERVDHYSLLCQHFSFNFEPCFTSRWVSVSRGEEL